MVSLQLFADTYNRDVIDDQIEANRRK